MPLPKLASLLRAPARSLRRRITTNPLVIRDARALRRRWRGRRGAWFLIAVALVQVVFCLNFEAIMGREPEDIVLYCYFAFFHIYLLLWTPLRSIRIAARAASTGELRDALVAPIPHGQIFGWLWLRAFAPAIALVLILYAPLHVPFPWLHATGNPLGYWDAPTLFSRPPGNADWGLQPASEATVIALALGLLLLPWIRSRRVRLAAWIVSSLALGGVEMVLIARQSELLLYPATSHFHLFVTLAYFLSAAAYGCALGIAMGLKHRGDAAKALISTIALGVGIECLAFHVVFWSEVSDFYDLFGGWMPLVTLLNFYMVSTGALWMGVKWNLMARFARKPIEPL